MKLKYFDIAWFSKVDGPGNRVVLYLQGCNLKCPWCHSPHSREAESPLLFNRIRCIGCGICTEACEKGVHSIQAGIRKIERSICIKCGKCIEACPTSGRDNNAGALVLPTKSGEASEVFRMLLPQMEVLKSCGGLTLSGGEALLQKEAVLEILQNCKSSGIHTALETSLTLPPDTYPTVSDYVDCWLVGMRDAFFDKNYSALERNVFENAAYLGTLKTRKIARFPIIKGLTHSEYQLERFARLVETGKISEIELLPCNKSMKHYYELSGIKQELAGDKALPGEKDVEGVVSFFNSLGLSVKVL